MTNMAANRPKTARDHAHLYAERLPHLHVSHPAHLYVDPHAHQAHLHVKSHVLQEEDATILQLMNYAAAMESSYLLETQACACWATSTLLNLILKLAMTFAM
jgi:hypothetical protein